MNMPYRFSDEWWRGGKELCNRIMELLRFNPEALYFSSADLRSRRDFIYQDIDPTGEMIPAALAYAQQSYRQGLVSHIHSATDLVPSIPLFQSLYRDFERAWVVYTITPRGNPADPIIFIDGVFETEEEAAEVARIQADRFANVDKALPLTPLEELPPDHAQLAEKLKDAKFGVVVKELW
jgi:hypothetical protein